jgi:CheY-like chemotaxis protein
MVIVIIMKRLPTVLIVDDDDILRRIYKAMLSGEFNVIEARNGKEALDAYLRSYPDVVLMDVVMPVMDGIQATREILKANPDAIVIGVTAYAPEKGTEMLKAGARDVIPKPVKREDFVDRIKRIIRG